MFKDYYHILGISYPASDEEIKKAYRQMSLKWHPDKNPGRDVVREMQDINEAYAILKDEEKKKKYDLEYVNFVSVFLRQKETNFEKEFHKSSEWNNGTQEWCYDYDIKDEHLKEDIKAARKYAKELVEEFMQSFKEASKAAVKGAAKTSFQYAISWIIAGFILTILGLIVRTCNA